MRVGYYVNNEYEDAELKDNPPSEPLFDKLIRTIATDQPRVTKFKIIWESTESIAAAAAASANNVSSEMCIEMNSVSTSTTTPIECE